jgi:magnesium transporter
MKPKSKIALHQLVTMLTKYMESSQNKEISFLIEPLSPSELARLIESLPSKYRNFIATKVSHKIMGEVLLELHRDVRRSLIGKMPPEELQLCLSSLQMDELADIDKDLPISVINAMVGAMDSQRLERYNLVRTFPDDTAGGLMDADATAIRSDVSLKAVYRYLCKYRRKVGELPEHLDSLIVVDRNNCVQGILALSDLASLSNTLSVSEAMNTSPTVIDSLTPANEVAQLFKDRDLLSAPVVDINNNLLGRITVDDVIDVLRNEADKEIYSKAGLSTDYGMFSPVIKSSLHRAVWLGANLVTAFIAAAVIGLFEASIEQIVALAVLMPVVASMGGITGSQTLTLVTRGMALDQIGETNIVPLAIHELKVSAINGILWALVVFLVANFWYQDWQLGAVFAVAIFAVSLTGTLSGAIIPMVLKKLGVDPAIAGGVVLTTITDAVGFLIFLGTASKFLL